MFALVHAKNADDSTVEESAAYARIYFSFVLSAQSLTGGTKRGDFEAFVGLTSIEDGGAVLS